MTGWLNKSIDPGKRDSRIGDTTIERRDHRGYVASHQCDTGATDS